MKQQINVLIADDTAKTRRGLKALLRFYTFIDMIWEASNGEDALLIISEMKPDIVIMDIQMPVVDGLKATRWIKQSWPEVKVIILTMYSQFESEAMEAGADYIIIKGDESQSIPDVIGHIFFQEDTKNENKDCKEPKS